MRSGTIWRRGAFCLSAPYWRVGFAAAGTWLARLTALQWLGLVCLCDPHFVRGKPNRLLEGNRFIPLPMGA